MAYTKTNWQTGGYSHIRKAEQDGTGHRERGCADMP